MRVLRAAFSGVTFALLALLRALRAFYCGGHKAEVCEALVVAPSKQSLLLRVVIDNNVSLRLSYFTCNSVVCADGAPRWTAVCWGDRGAKTPRPNESSSPAVPQDLSDPASLAIATSNPTLMRASPTRPCRRPCTGAPLVERVHARIGSSHTSHRRRGSPPTKASRHDRPGQL